MTFEHLFSNKYRSFEIELSRCDRTYFEWSDDKIYCSELVWKIYKEIANIEIGKLERLSDFDLSNEIVQNKMKERYGENIPANEKVISPAEMFNSDKLITIEEK